MTERLKNSLTGKQTDTHTHTQVGRHADQRTDRQDNVQSEERLTEATEKEKHFTSRGIFKPKKILNLVENWTEFMLH